MSQRTLFLVAAFAFAALHSSSSQALAEGDPKTQRLSAPSWPSFGHTFGWKRNVKLANRPNLRPEWKIKVGEGSGQVVGDKETIFVASGVSSENDGDVRIETIVAAYAAKDGRRKWTHRQHSVMSDKQQTFGGGNAIPHATPLRIQDRLIVATFMGDLSCLDAATGKPKWQLNTIDTFGAEPVQFGYSSSPVACPASDGTFMVLAGGDRGGLVKFSTDNEQPIWTCPISGFSYSTPVFATVADVDQWIVLAQDEVLGIRDRDGEVLWRSELEKGGLTNVPSPLLAAGDRILISCQGCEGVKCLQVVKDNDTWTVRESWSNRTQFFYTNWMMLNDRIAIGCTDRYLTAFDCDSGKQLGRWRGFGDGNIFRAGDRILVLNGTGDLSLLDSERNSQDLRLTQRFTIGEGRFWTTPSLIASRLYVRNGEQLSCYSFEEHASRNDVRNQITSRRKQTRLKLDASTGSDPVAEIFERFETKGKESALALYAERRRAGKLNVDHRIQLAEAAESEGLQELANLILQHAAADFPESERLKSELSKRHDR